jgi:Family of unknown function (DUF5681)
MDNGETRSANYDVGYGKPPAGTRFMKGKSGNLRGRPRSKFRPKPSQAADQLTEEMFLYEAYRPVQIVVGKKVVTMSATQQIIRSNIVAAMKGNRQGQNAHLERVQKLESKRNAARFEFLTWVLDYKAACERIWARNDAEGVPRAVPLPYPDDFIIDPVKGEARFHGPMTLEQVADCEECMRFRDAAQMVINDFASRISKRTNKKVISLRLKLQRGFDEFNDVLPKRWQKTLQNRL